MDVLQSLIQAASVMQILDTIDPSNISIHQDVSSVLWTLRNGESTQLSLKKKPIMH